MNREGKYMNLSNGRPCVHGYCEAGVCEVQVEDMIQRFWSVIEDLSVDGVLKFMRNNLVGTILLLSIIIWIPASCTFSHFDKKRQQEEETIIDWHSGKNSGLIPDNQRNKVRLKPAPEVPRITSGFVRYPHKLVPVASGSTDRMTYV